MNQVLNPPKFLSGIRCVFGCICFMFFYSSQSLAQPGCPNISCGPNTTVDCNITCVDLTATILETGATTDYAVSSVPYAPPLPFTGGTAQFINTDDIWGDVINLPFNFCFYGNTYNQVVIGANGLLTFDISLAGTYCDWAFTDAIPSANLPTNSIMGAYHDIDPSVCTGLFTPVCPADINYSISGSAPCRIFSVSFTTVPQYSCNNLETTQQIVLYETTNVIEVYIQDKPTCNGWNSGNAIIGIQDAAGTTGLTAPGRNTGAWTASNEGWRFTPDGAPNYVVNWYDGGTLIGNGLTVNVCPSATTTYDAEAVYTNCDGNEVTVTDQVTVTQNSTVSVTVTPNTVDVCNGQTTTLTASSANSGMSYIWSPATGLSATTGISVDATPSTTTTYTVTGNDGTCSASANATINVVEITVTPSSTDASCAGNDGTATATPNGGVAPYAYSWNTVPAQNAQTATGLGVGDYDVSVTDATGCSVTETITVSLSAGSLSPPQMSSTDAVCTSDNGTAAATPVDGNAPFTYLWDDPNAQNTQTATALAAGTYNVIMTDAGGCQSTNSITVGLDQGSMITTINVFNDVTCNGLCDGDATVDVQNGLAPIQYLWDDPNNQTTQTASNLCPGLYNVGVLDANGCVATAQISISEPTVLSVSAIMDQPSTCGQPDGVASATANGGTVAVDYSYGWNSTPTQNAASAMNLVPNTYTVTATDDNGCTATANVDVTATQGFSASISSYTDATCFQGCDGDATVQTDAGAVLPVSFSWSTTPAQSTQTAINLCAGNYNVTLTDDAGCIATTNVTIQEPIAVNAILDASASPICIGESSDLSAILSGGTPTYTGYSWVADPPDATLNSTEQNPAVLPEVTTTYTFVGTDANGCQSPAKFVTVEVLPPLSLEVVRPLVSPDTGICPYDFAVIDLVATGGNGNYTYYLEPDIQNPIQLPMQVQPNTTTTYNLTVLDGCTTPAANANSTITVFELPTVDFSGDELSGCHIHTVNFTDETSPEPASWNWNFGDPNSSGNTSPFQNPTHEFSAAGLYSISLEVESAEGCVNDTTLSNYIEVFPLPNASFELNPERTNVLAGTIEFTDLSTPDIATWNWSFGNGDMATDQNPVYTYIDTGMYMVELQITTIHGCEDDVSRTVQIDPDVMFYIPNSFTPNGDGRNDFFRPYGEGVKWETFEMFIYDRWGENIYYTADINDPWDGWYKDREVEMGVYVYKILIRDQNGEEHVYHDGVTLFR